MSKQFRFDQFGRNGGAIQCNEWARRPWTPLMQRPCNQLLARTGFAHDADTDLAGGHALYLGHHLFHGLAGPNDFMFSQPLAEPLVLGFQPL